MVSMLGAVRDIEKLDNLLTQEMISVEQELNALMSEEAKAFRLAQKAMSLVKNLVIDLREIHKLIEGAKGAKGFEQQQADLIKAREIIQRVEAAIPTVIGEVKMAVKEATLDEKFGNKIQEILLNALKQLNLAWKDVPRMVQPGRFVPI